MYMSKSKKQLIEV